MQKSTARSSGPAHSISALLPFGSRYLLFQPLSAFPLSRPRPRARALRGAAQLVLDRGDVVGGAVSIAGAMIISFWPR